MCSDRSEQKRLAVAVFPVPTPPVRNAEHWRPCSASGLNSISSLDICSSRCTSLVGTYE